MAPSRGIPFFPILFARCLVSVKFGRTKEIFGSLLSTMKLLIGFSESLFNSKEIKLFGQIYSYIEHKTVFKTRTKQAFSDENFIFLILSFHCDSLKAISFLFFLKYLGKMPEITQNL